MILRDRITVVGTNLTQQHNYYFPNTLHGYIEVLLKEHFAITECIPTKGTVEFDGMVTFKAEERPARILKTWTTVEQS